MGELKRRQVLGYLIGIIEDYFRDRKVDVTRAQSIDMHKGVPQGSVIGPTLWNVLYDSVLRLKMRGHITTVTFADDLAILVEADRPEVQKARGDLALKRVNNWMNEHRLTLTSEKTEAIILKGYRRRPEIAFNLLGTVIQPAKKIKYLGIYFDRHGTFSQHVIEACGKADRYTGALQRLLPNLKGPSSNKRILLGVVQ